MKGLKIFLGFLCIICSFSAIAQQESWPIWVQKLKVEAVNNGVKPELFDAVFSNFQGPNLTVLKLYNSQPEHRMTFLQYRQTRANQPRIQMGRQELQKNKALLTSIGKTYQVDPCIILSLWGLETDYGRFMGHFSVPYSLATLAYDSRRPAFFRNELIKALLILQEGQVSLANFKGEWAGASGYPQFLPASWYKYAVDYSGTGRKDIWKNLPDGLASIANYLAKNGWRKGELWGTEVHLPSNFDESLIGKNIIKTVDAWRSLGVQVNHSISGNLDASIIRPGEEGPIIMVFNNFRTLQSWNDSNYYVSTVGYLSDQICQR